MVHTGYNYYTECIAVLTILYSIGIGYHSIYHQCSQVFYFIISMWILCLEVNFFKSVVSNHKWSLCTGFTLQLSHYIYNSASSNCVGNTICTMHKYNIAWCLWAGKMLLFHLINGYNFGIVKAMDFLWMLMYSSEYKSINLTLSLWVLNHL